jgi:hypothetical protein
VRQWGERGSPPFGHSHRRNFKFRGDQSCEGPVSPLVISCELPAAKPDRLARFYTVVHQLLELAGRRQ